MGRVAPTYGEFIVEYPEFADASPTKVECQLALSARLFSVSSWEDFYSDAVGLDAAHNLVFLRIEEKGGTQGGLQGAMGPVSSVSAAGVSTSFATASPQGKSATDDWYLKTSYGQRLLRLRRSVIPMGVMAS